MKRKIRIVSRPELDGIACGFAIQKDDKTTVICVSETAKRLISDDIEMMRKHLKVYRVPKGVSLATFIGDLLRKGENIFTKEAHDAIRNSEQEGTDSGPAPRSES